jgi:hypothetical protein
LAEAEKPFFFMKSCESFQKCKKKIIMGDFCVCFQEQQNHAPMLKMGALTATCFESLQNQGISRTDDSLKYSYSSSPSGYGKTLLLLFYCLSGWGWGLET